MSYIQVKGKILCAACMHACMHNYIIKMAVVVLVPMSVEVLYLQLYWFSC